MGLVFYLVGLAVTAYIMVMYSEPRLFGLMAAMIIAGLAGLIEAWIFLLRVRLGLTAAVSANSEERGVLFVMLDVFKGGFLPLGIVDVRLKYKNDFDSGKGHHQWVRLYINGSKKTASVRLMLESAACGQIRISADRIRVRDYLGIWRFSKKTDEHAMALIMPAAKPVSVKPSGDLMQYLGDSEVFSETESGNDPSEVFDVRPYQPGDALSRIHWKLSARKDETMVKQLSKPLVMPLVLAVSMMTSDETQLLYRIHALITAAYSLGEALLAAECEFVLVTQNISGAWGRFMIIDREHLNEAFQVLIRSGYGKNVNMDARAWYIGECGQDSYYTFLTLDLDRMQLLKDGEAIAQVESEGHPFSGEDILL